MSLPSPLVRLIEELQRLPGIGPKGAQRLAFHILKTPREDADRLADAVREVKERVSLADVAPTLARYMLPRVELSGYAGQDLLEHLLEKPPARRLPILLVSASKDMLVRILVEPKNCLYNQFTEIFRNEGVELSVDRKVFEQIAALAIEYKTGARSLRGIFEELITPVLYKVPDDPSIKKVEIASLFTEPQYIRQG